MKQCVHVLLGKWGKHLMFGDNMQLITKSKFFKKLSYCTSSTKTDPQNLSSQIHSESLVKSRSD